MPDVLIPEGQVYERLGIRTLYPLVVPSQAKRVNIRRFNLQGHAFLHRGDIVKLLRAESEQVGGDPVLDRLAKLIVEVTS